VLKKIIGYIIVFVSVGTISFFVQYFFLKEQQVAFGQVLKTSYLFHGCFSFLLVSAFNILSGKKQIFDQLGFIYIGLLVFKLIFFGFMMHRELIGEEILPRNERAGLLVPVIIFIFLEVVYLKKIFKQKTS